MKQITLIFVLVAGIAAAQGVSVSGTVTDDGGTPIAGAIVSASLRSSAAAHPLTPGKVPAFMAVMAKKPSGANGDFAIDGLLQGTYVLCVRANGPYLDPCVWADQPVSVDTTVGSVISGARVVAARGVTVTVRVNDPAALITADPAKDDVIVGTYNGRLPFVPALVDSRDANGKTMRIVAPAGKPVVIGVASATMALADDKDNGLGDGETKFTIPANKIVQTPAGVGAATPTLTVQVKAAKKKQ
jgi:hypothetical protein